MNRSPSIGVLHRSYIQYPLGSTIIAVGDHFFSSIRYIASGLALTFFLHGCGPPPISLDSSHSFSRIGAIQRAAANDDKASIPRLITLLESDDPAVRMLSIRTLERMTGQTFGYDHAAPEPEREHSIDLWEEWYLKQTGMTPAQGREELRRKRALQEKQAGPDTAPPTPPSPSKP